MPKLSTTSLVAMEKHGLTRDIMPKLSNSLASMPKLSTTQSIPKPKLSQALPSPKANLTQAMPQ